MVRLDCVLSASERRMAVCGRATREGSPLPTTLRVNQSYVPTEAVQCGNSRVATDEAAARERVGLCWVRSERRGRKRQGKEGQSDVIDSDQTRDPTTTFVPNHCRSY